MILTSVKSYIKEHKQASLAELSRHFETEVDAIKPMLEHLMAKGYITKVQTKVIASCGKEGGCGGCSFASNSCSYSPAPEVFKWN